MGTDLGKYGVPILTKGQEEGIGEFPTVEEMRQEGAVHLLLFVNDVEHGLLEGIDVLLAR